MIIKELDQFYGKTSWDFSGRKAEEDMAFYLKRRFHDNEELFVINNLRFAWLDSHVQIDHLVLCRYGAIIIESKSVRNKVKYEGEQWFRLWDNHWIGMKNPVLQAKEQGNALKELLRQNYKTLLDKFMFGLIQKGFGNLPIQCFVAISDTGILIPPKKNDLYSEQVFKAEAITNKIEAYYENLKHMNSVFSKKYEPWDMSKEELQRVISFLLSVHIPNTPYDILPQETEEEEAEIVQQTQQPIKNNEQLSSVKSQPSESETQSTAAQSNTVDEQEITTYDNCPYCGGKITILWGAKFKNYYWHCESCGKNISINYKCPKCHERLRIKKLGIDYCIYCITCGLQEHYFSDKK